MSQTDFANRAGAPSGFLDRRTLGIVPRAGQTDAGAAMAEMTQAEWRRFQNYGQPLMDRLLELSNDTSIVDQAYSRAGTNLAQTQGQIERALGRRIPQMSPAQKRLLKNRMESSVALDNASSLSDAYQKQRDYRYGTISEALATANLMQDGATNTLNNVASAQYNRQIAESQARQARRSSITGLLGQAGGLIFGG